ncbi:aminotransferase-like domain-containing protein [Amphritea balenae]|uniref:PLP-dependent aminotransferase family protein n=1 Tax=Amphritea balenae TaxID=452629 RepID=A0A3P1SSB1_9GAMM|nr:PLP-dependent aminotransferase family protein [Amphritea balenae]RRD00011.1 PLP-dependent aminotransferase family protein [Amphritea balenae]GGK75847.1 transcriptional regulator [Amphritea balenae]
MNFLYQALEQQLTKQIESGQLPLGSRLPSVRSLCKEQSLSKSTVLTAYARLEAAGLVNARPKSGYFVCYQPQSAVVKHRAEQAQPPAFINQDALLLDIMDQSSAFDICPGQTEPSCNEPLRRCLGRAARRQKGADQHYYNEPSGLLGLRKQLQRRCADGGSRVTEDQLVVTGGCQHSLLLALMAVTRPGDTVAVESPGFYGVLQLLESLGLKAVEIPSLVDTGLSPDALLMALQNWSISALVVMPAYATPTGACMTDQNRQRLVNIVAQYDLPVIEDDIYGDLTFALQRPRTLHSYAQDQGFDGVMLCSSISKSLSRDLRIGWIVPGRYLAEVKKLKLVTMLAGSHMSQLGLQMYMEEGSYERHIRHYRQQLVQQCAQLQQLIRQLFPDTVTYSQPRGGLVLWLELPEHIDTLALYNQARQFGISITPGQLFSSQDRYQNCLRLSFAQPWNEPRIAALKTLAGLVIEWTEPN